MKKNNIDFAEFWQNENAEHYYFMGQDNLTFHTIFWPGQLIGQKKSYNLPYYPNIFKFLNANGAKLSKSRNNIIDALEVCENYTADVIRFYIISILPENKEGNWDWTDFKNRVNSELVGNIGNFIHRVLVFTQNKILSKEVTLENISVDDEVKIQCEKSIVEFKNFMKENQFVSALNVIKSLSNYGNRYFDHNKPWVLLNSDFHECTKIILSCLQIVHTLRILMYPMLPGSSDILSSQIGLSKLLPSVGDDKIVYGEIKFSDIKLSNLTPLFKKIEDEDLP